MDYFSNCKHIIRSISRTRDHYIVAWTVDGRLWLTRRFNDLTGKARDAFIDELLAGSPGAGMIDLPELRGRQDIPDAWRHSAPLVQEFATHVWMEETRDGQAWAARLTEALKKRRMSRAAFARACGCSASNISGIINACLKGRPGGVVPKYLWEKAREMFPEIRDYKGGL